MFCRLLGMKRNSAGKESAVGEVPRDRKVVQVT